jgi:hypothetical protein
MGAEIKEPTFKVIFSDRTEVVRAPNIFEAALYFQRQARKIFQMPHTITQVRDDLGNSPNPPLAALPPS